MFGKVGDLLIMLVSWGEKGINLKLCPKIVGAMTLEIIFWFFFSMFISQTNDGDSWWYCYYLNIYIHVHIYLYLC